MNIIQNYKNIIFFKKSHFLFNKHELIIHRLQPKTSLLVLYFLQKNLFGSGGESGTGSAIPGTGSVDPDPHQK